LLIVVLTILPVLVVLVVYAVLDRREALARADKQVISYAQLKIGYYREFAAQTQAMLETLAAIPAVSTGRQPDCSVILVQILVRDQRYSNFGVAGDDGRLKCSAVAYGSADRLLGRASVIGALQSGGFTISGYEFSAITHAPVVTLAQPIADNKSGVVTGVVFAAVPLQWLSSVDGSELLPRGNRFYLVDDQGHILVARPALQKPENLLTLLPGSHWNPDNTAFGRDQDGRLLLYGRARLHVATDASELYAVVGLPTQVIFSETNTVLVRNLLLIAGLLTLLALLVWAGSELLVLHPIRVLLGTVNRIADGDFKVEVARKGSSELIELGLEFERMAAALRLRQTEVHRQLEQIQRLSRLNRVISGVNSAILRLRERNKLLEEACRVAVLVGEFRFAWAGLLEADQERVQPVTYFGSGKDYFQKLRLSIRPELPEGQGIVGRALRAGEHAICNDLETDPGMRYWLEGIRDHGYRSAGAFLLKIEGRSVGVLAVYSHEPDFFDSEEIRLMQEVAADIGYGLEHITKTEQADFLANFDALTGLPNKTCFLSQLGLLLERAQATRRMAAAAVVQLKGLGRINDVHGYAAGDEAIKQAVAALAAHVRPGDLLARVGDDTLAILMSNLKRQGELPTLVADTLQAFPLVVRVDRQELVLRIAAGVAIYPQDAAKGTDLFRQAELMLHTSTEETATPYRFYSSEIDQQSSEHYVLESALHHALDRKELRLFYQPIVDIRSRAIIGMEALLRWNTPEYGSIAPARFIPLAEENGEIVPIGYWVIEQACRQMQSWQERDLQLVPVSINVSARQLQKPDFAERVKSILSRFTCPASLLSLEITESQLMSTTGDVVRQLASLREVGLHLALDDFGTGYASLSYLNQLPVDTLKIDRSFIMHLHERTVNEVMVKSIMGLARSLELKVVAEGVERKEQFSILEKLGCDYAQGYLFSRPVPTEKAGTLLGTSI
jgi:diguanylate cyclase (GGDEF)-like protein